MIKGNCLCGAVAYEAGPLTGPIGHCHCRTCQKAHSAAFATTARTARADFRWTEGEDRLRSYESSPGKVRWFCGDCGSQLMAEWKTSDQVILRIGCVEEGLDAKPERHIWISHAAAWDPGPEDHLPRFAEAPGH